MKKDVKVIRNDWVLNYKKGDRFLNVFTFKKDFSAYIPYAKWNTLLNFVLFAVTIALTVMTLNDWDATISVGRIGWHVRTFILYIGGYTLIQLRVSRVYGFIRSQFIALFGILGAFAMFEIYHLAFNLVYPNELTGELWVNNFMQIVVFLFVGILYISEMMKYYKINKKYIIIALVIFNVMWGLRFPKIFFDNDFWGFWIKGIAVYIFEIMILKEKKGIFEEIELTNMDR
jgi:hypothetical protein